MLDCKVGQKKGFSCAHAAHADLLICAEWFDGPTIAELPTITHQTAISRRDFILTMIEARNVDFVKYLLKHHSCRGHINSHLRHATAYFDRQSPPEKWPRTFAQLIKNHHQNAMAATASCVLTRSKLTNQELKNLFASIDEALS